MQKIEDKFGAQKLLIQDEKLLSFYNTILDGDENFNFYKLDAEAIYAIAKNRVKHANSTDIYAHRKQDDSDKRLSAPPLETQALDIKMVQRLQHIRLVELARTKVQFCISIGLF